MAGPVLETRDVTKAFGGLVAVDGVTAAFEEDDLTAIVGPNGAGKTTYFNLITGALSPDSGEIYFKGEPVTDDSPPEIAKKGLVRSYQIAQLFEELSVIENVQVGIRSKRNPLNFWRDESKDEGMVEAGERVLEEVGLVDQRDTTASTLSHGERRALEIAIAVGTDPALLLLDEPLAGMNMEETEKIVDLIQRLNEGTPVVLVEHNMDVVMDVSDRVVVLHQGRKIADGPPADVRQDETVRQVYLGED